MNHTPEPWRPLGITYPDNIIGPSGQVLAVVDRSHKDHRANAKRILACVNACAGLPDPAVITKMRALAQSIAPQENMWFEGNPQLEALINGWIEAARSIVSDTRLKS